MPGDIIFHRYKRVHNSENKTMYNIEQGVENRVYVANGRLS